MTLNEANCTSYCQHFVSASQPTNGYHFSICEETILFGRISGHLMEMSQENWMREALVQAQKAFELDEVPIGAVVVFGNRIIGRGYNMVESLKDPTAHAEIIAIGAATRTIDSKILDSCSIYVTLEPCAMCAGAIVLSKIKQLIFGAWDEKSGACGSLRNIVSDSRLNHQVAVTPALMAEEASFLLKAFFKARRDEVANR